MAENYKIKLGINFDNSELENVKRQLNNLTDNTHRVRIDIDNSRLLKQINHAKSELRELNGTKGKQPSLTINTQSLENSLSRVADVIEEVKRSLGTLDDKSGMKSLLSSVNQIATALGKVENESDNLVKSLTALGKKDFSLNLGINMGGANPIARNQAYGSKVRGETLPQLKQQVDSLVKYYNDTYKKSVNEFEALQKLVAGTKLNDGAFFEDFLLGRDSVATRMNSGSLASQMQAYKQYIDMFKQAASLKGLDLSSVTSGFSKQADELIKDAQNIQSGANDMEESVEKLKRVFGGSGVDSEGLSASLSPIISDLKVIRESIESLSKNNSIDSLVQSFNRLSETIEKLTSNLVLAKNTLDTGFSNVVPANNVSTSLKQIENAEEEIARASTTSTNTVVQNEERKQQAYQETANKVNKLDNISIDINDGNIDDIKNALKSMNVDDSGIEEATRELNELNIVAKNVSASFKNGQLVKVDIKGIETMSNGLERAVTATASFGENGVTSSTRFAQALDDGVEAAKRLKKEVAAVENIKDNIKVGNFAENVDKMHVNFNRLSSASEELEASVKEVDAAYTEMLNAANIASGDEVADRQRLIQAEKAYAEALERTNNAIRQQARVESAEAAANKLAQDKKSLKLDTENWLKENTRAAREYGAELRRLISLLDRVDNPDAFRNIARDIKNVQKTAQVMGKTGLTVFDRLKAKAKEYASYLSAAELFMYAEQAFRSMFEQVKLIDSAMTELKKVTDETNETYNKFLTNAASRAKEIGTTIDGLVKSTADFARLGYEFEDAQGLAEVANIYAVVGDDIDNVETATQSLISTLTAFKNEAGDLSDSDFALSIVDKMNEVSNNFAISSGGIGEALQRSASSMMAANNSLDETIALITAANTVVQDADSVGTAFKTISMRIRGAKSEMEDLGMDTDGMVESTAKLRSEIMALTGVDIMDGANQFKSTYAIMDELADKWQDLSDIQQATVTELIAGKRQGNIVSSLMNNFDIAEQALETSLNSAGSAMDEHAKWQKSLEAQTLKLKAAWQGLSQAFLNSDFLKVALKAITGLTEGITELIDTFGGLPTLIGAISTGMSLFKNTGIFSVFNKDVIGAQKQLALLGKSFKDISVDIVNGRGLFKSLFDKSISESDIARLKAFNVEIGNGVPLNEALAKTMDGATDATYRLAAGANGGQVELGGLTNAANRGKAAMFGLELASAAANAAITMGISFAISALIKWVDKLVVTKEELAEKVDGITSKFKEQHDELKRLKGDFDTSNEDSMISRYGKLSKGIDEYGENIALTADEYAEYQNIVNTVADQIPSLVVGYNSQGDAILSCAGSVSKLREEYEGLIRTQNKEVLNNGADIFKDFTNDYLTASLNSGNSVEAIKELERLKELSNDELEAALIGNPYAIQISELLRVNGVERDVLGSGEAGYETHSEHIIRAITEDRNEIQNVLDQASKNLKAYAEDMGSVTKAYFSNAFLGEYSGISNEMQNIINDVVSNFDSEFYADFIDDALTPEEQYKKLTEYYDSILDAFNNLGYSDTKQLEAVFNLKTKFNNGEISYGEYVNSLQNAGELISDLGLDEELETQLKLSIGLNEDGIVEEYQNLVNRISDHTNYDFDPRIMGSAAEKFISSLSSDEFSVAIDVITRLSNNGVEESIQQIQAAIDREMAVRGLTFDLNLEVEITGVEAFNTALQESVSASGLSSESIAALKGRYKDLESEGYNLSAMFEETSNGIHLNRNAVRELEEAYAEQKKSDIESDLKALKKEYDLLTEDIENCNDASERASLYVQRDAIIQQINDAATLAAQYEGLTSAYNDWLAAEEAGQERDMYENMLEGFENIDDEISRGWLDDGTIEFLELLTGRTDLATLSAKELKEVYNGLDDKIKDTGYSIRDFFTVDEDGNSTSRGVYNFLDAIGQLEEEKFGGKDVVKRNKDGKVIEFDLKLAGGKEAVADALGISEELVEIMLRAADDAGFVINLEGAYTQLADLKTEAEAARDTLISLQKNGLAKLKGVDVNFNLDAEGDDLLAEHEKAVNLLDKFRNKDGTINLNMEGAQEALDIAEYLTIKLDDLTEPRYMQIDVSTLEEDLQTPIEQMQEFERLSKEKHLLTLTGDTKALEETEEKMSDIVEYLSTLDEDTKKKIGIDINWDEDEIAERLESGEIEIPAELNLDVQMSDDLKDMRLMMMHQLGLISEEEVKLKVGYDIDESVISNLTDEQQKVVVEFIAENEEWFNTLSDEDKEIAIELIANREFDELTDEEKEVVIDIVGDDEALGALESFDEHGTTIQALCEVSGVETVDDLAVRLEGLDDEQISVVADVIGRIDVEALNNAMSLLESEEVEAIATAIGQGDVEALKTVINDLEPTKVEAIAIALGYDSVEELNGAMENLTDKDVAAIAQVLGITDVDSLWAAIDRLTDKNVNAIANVEGKEDVDGLKSAIDNLKGKSITIWASIRRKASSLWRDLMDGGDDEGGSGVNGTANSSGSSFANGTALKQGNWRTKKTETALTGELGREIVVTPQNRWYTVGDNGAEFVNIPRGSIVFNHRQTEELLSNGKVTSDGGRGRALVGGTAYALRNTNTRVADSGIRGSDTSVGAPLTRIEYVIYDTSAGAYVSQGSSRVVTPYSGIGLSGDGIDSDSSSFSSGSGSGSGGGGGGSDSSDKEFEEVLDWIEVIIDRVERAIDKFEQQANNIYSSWSSRNDALINQTAKVQEEISIQQQAYNRYMQAANAVGLSSSWAEKVHNGKIDIETIKDEALAEKIKSYQDYYEKALDCEDAIEELREEESKLYAQRFENVQTKYDGILQGYEHTEAMLNEYISQAEEQGYIVSKKYYDALVSNEKSNIAELKKEQADLIAERDNAVAEGKIVKGSEAW